MGWGIVNIQILQPRKNEQFVHGVDSNIISVLLYHCYSVIELLVNKHEGRVIYRKHYCSIHSCFTQFYQQLATLLSYQCCTILL